MHGRKKENTSEEKLREKKEKDRLRAQEYSQLTKKVFELRAKPDYSVDALKTTEKLLSMNADCYTVWNYRREIFQDLAGNKSLDEMNALYKQELSWLEWVLSMWPKSYWVWHHRKWIGERYKDMDWNRELQLCVTMHKADQRNFHCWNYRRFAAAKANSDYTNELKMTMQLIEADPSNYSAWHYRSVLIPRLYSGEELSTKITEEFELIKQALWTDPNDQSAWLYHHWLVGIRKNKDPEKLSETLEQELNGCEELLAEEPDSKWALLTSVLLMLDQKDDSKKSLILERLSKLENIDKAHCEFYKELSKKL